MQKLIFCHFWNSTKCVFVLLKLHFFLILEHCDPDHPKEGVDADREQQLDDVVNEKVDDDVDDTDDDEGGIRLKIVSSKTDWKFLTVCTRLIMYCKCIKYT